MVDVCDYGWLKNSLQSVFGYIGPDDSGIRYADAMRLLKPKNSGMKKIEPNGQCLITNYDPE